MHTVDTGNAPVDRAARAARLDAVAAFRPIAVCLVACGKQKLDRPAPGRDLYTGSLFRASLAHALATSDVVFIASALHGLVELDEVLAPYDVRLCAGGAHAWARKLVVQLEAPGAIGHRRRQVTVLAGGAYASALSVVLRGDVLEPLHGMTLGSRLRWLAQQRRNREAVAAYRAAGGVGLSRGRQLTLADAIGGAL